MRISQNELMERSVPATQQELLLQYVKNVDLVELAPAIEVLAERVYEWRKDHNGFVPLAIFESLLSLGGVAVSVQIVNEVVDDGGKHIGFALKKRDATEAGWANLYNNTCCTARMTDHARDGLARDTKETFGATRDDESLELLGVVINHEKERHSTCYTLMHRRYVTLGEVKKFVGEWDIFTREEIMAHDPQIVNYNWDQLAYAMDPNRAKVAWFDTEAGIREGFE